MFVIVQKLISLLSEISKIVIVHKYLTNNKLKIELLAIIIFIKIWKINNQTIIVWSKKFKNDNKQLLTNDLRIFSNFIISLQV